MFTKLGKEKSLSLNPNFRLKYGTVDAKNLTAVYLEIQSWVKPDSEDMEFKKAVTYLRKTAYNAVRGKLNQNIFKENFIVDLDLRTSGMCVEKRSFMCLEVTLYVNEPLSFKSEAMLVNIKELLTDVTNSLEKNKFSFKPKKR